MFLVPYPQPLYSLTLVPVASLLPASLDISCTLDILRNAGLEGGQSRGMRRTEQLQ